MTNASSAPQVTAKPVYEFDAAKGRYGYAWRDLKAALSNMKLLRTLVSNDFAQRYQGTAMGGFWITLTTAATVSGLALVYSQIFNSPLNEFFPYVAVGMIIWGFVSGLVNDGVGSLVTGAIIFNQTPLPKSLFVLKMVGRAIVSFGFRSIVLVAVLVFTGVRPNMEAYGIVLLGLILLLWTGFWLALLLGTLGARFRDLGQFTHMGLTFAFFLTPVFWQAERLGEYQFILAFNPFYHFIHIIRGPLLGLDGVGVSYIWAVSIAALATLAGWAVFGHFARRLPYWC